MSHSVTCPASQPVHDKVLGRRYAEWTSLRGSGTRGSSNPLVAFDVLEEVGRGVIEGTLVNAVNDPLPDSVLSCVGVHGSGGLQLLQVPQNGLISRADAAANVPGRAAFRVLPQVTEDFSAQWVDAKKPDHSFCAFWDRRRGADIFGHTFILSHGYRDSFHCRIEYDTLQGKHLNKSDALEGVS